MTATPFANDEGGDVFVSRALEAMDEITALRAEVVQLRKMVGDVLLANDLAARTSLKTTDALIELLRGQKSKKEIADKLVAFIASRRVADDETIADARDHALAVHEAGHAVVAHALGVEVEAVEIDVAVGEGRTYYGDRSDDLVETIAVTSAGFLSEHLARHGARMFSGDARSLQRLLSHLPEQERRAVHAEGFRLAETILKARLDVVLKIADALLTRKWSSNSTVAYIDGDELEGLLANPRGEEGVRWTEAARAACSPTTSVAQT
jgi:hypothetical protein